MKPIITYLGSIINNNDVYLESLLDNEDTFYGANSDKKMVESWIRDNYKIGGNLTISDDLVVDCNNTVKIKNKSITSLTNGLFRWGNVGKSFLCNGCKSLISLEGAPKEVGGDFWCDYCSGLETLEGAPKKVGKNFDCGACDNLTTLEGAPKEVGRNFYCQECNNLETLEGAPEKIGNEIFCVNCNNLKITDSDRKKYKIYD